MHTDLDTRETLEKIIRMHPFWKGLNPVYFHILGACATGPTWGFGQAVFQADSDAENFYPRQGCYHASDERCRRSAGLVLVFPALSLAFSAPALMPSRKRVAFEARASRGYGEENHNFGYELARRLGQVMLQRLQATRLRLVNFYAAIKD